MSPDELPNVAILSEYYYPEESSTAQLLTELASGLAVSFDIQVVTSYPNYHEEDRAAKVPKHEIMNGTEIFRLRGTRFDKDSLLLRTINWFTYTLLATVWMLRRSFGVALVVSTPPTLPFGAWVAKRIRGTPYVFLIHDMYPDMPVALGLLSEDGVVERAWKRAMRAVYRDADRIIVLGESMDRHLRNEMEADASFDPGKIEVIPNWEDPDFIEPMQKTENEFAQSVGTIDQFTLLYSGNIGRYHEIETAIEAVSLLEGRGKTDIQLLVIGEGARKEELQEFADRLGVENVEFQPFQPTEKLPETLTCGDASLVGIKPEMEGLCVSSKLYSALAAGLPILAIVGEGDEVARVITEADCGVRVDQSNADRVADILERWADDRELTSQLGTNARKFFENHYTKGEAVESYSTVLSDVVQST